MNNPNSFEANMIFMDKSNRTKKLKPSFIKRSIIINQKGSKY